MKSRIVWEEEETGSFISNEGKEIPFLRREAILSEYYIVQAIKFFKNIQISLIETSLEPGYGEASENLCSQCIVKSWKVPIQEIGNNWLAIKKEILQIIKGTGHGAK